MDKLSFSFLTEGKLHNQIILLSIDFNKSSTDGNDRVHVQYKSWPWPVYRVFNSSIFCQFKISHTITWSRGLLTEHDFDVPRAS